MIYTLDVKGQEVELANLEEFPAEFKFDIRYARKDNFLGKVVYPSPRAFLLKHVAHDLLNVHLSLKPHGLGLLIFDGYRPWSVTKLFWDESSPQVREFLANPDTGSSHNRGCAVDLSLFRLSNGESVQMPSDFDEMNEKAYVDYQGGTLESRKLRDLLRSKMEQNGFTGIKNEWWHYNHVSNHSWPVMDFQFDEILSAPKKVHAFFKR